MDADIHHQTDRLILRDWCEEDRAPFAAMNADPMVMEYFQSELTLRQSDALVDRISAHIENHGFGLFALERKLDGAFIGFTGMLTCPSSFPLAGEIEIGWRVAREHWRHGYAYEAASACMDWFWCNTEFPRLVSYTSDHNDPSQNLMRKLGFEHRPELEFDHPTIPRENPLCHQVVFVADRKAQEHA